MDSAGGRCGQSAFAMDTAGENEPFELCELVFLEEVESDAAPSHRYGAEGKFIGDGEIGDGLIGHFIQTKMRFRHQNDQLGRGILFEDAVDIAKRKPPETDIDHLPQDFGMGHEGDDHTVDGRIPFVVSSVRLRG